MNVFSKILYALVESGIGGEILVIILLVAFFVWCAEMFMLPFYISRVNDNVAKILEQIKERTEK